MKRKTRNLRFKRALCRDILWMSCLFLCVQSFSSYGQRKNLIFEDTFSKDSLDKKWIKESCCDHSLNIANDPTSKKNQVLKVELFKTDPIVANSKRSEVRMMYEPKVEVERWYGFSMFLPEGYEIDPSPEIVAQWHEVPDFSLGETWRSPPVALSINKNNWKLNMMWASAAVNTNETVDGRKSFDLGKIKTGEWTHWVFHLKFSWKPDGMIEVWKNGQKVINWDGPNAYNDQKGLYFKTGFYKWKWKPSNDNGESVTTYRVIYLDNYRIGDEKAGFKDVSPKK